MVYIPYTDECWAAIEEAFRQHQYPKKDTRKKLPVREVAAWWAIYSGTRAGFF
jgi:hypothetical protein